MDRDKLLSWSIAIGLAILVSVLAILVWLGSFSGNFNGITIYQIFPIFGLLAFSLMWTHYITGFLKRVGLLHTELPAYYQVTGYIVLVAILLHPGLLIYQLYRDGLGLPPGSEYKYVRPGLGWLTTLGFLCLTVFLSYELRRWFKDKSWWKYVTYLNDAAMLGIFYHGLRLGTQTEQGWYNYIWWFYGVTLVGCLVYKYYEVFRENRLRSTA